jgi:protoporphyrinogen/coproporphyrinogen III oxidase
MQTPRTFDTIVAGGGIAGLAVAYELSRRGISFVVLEASGRVGGVILSEQVDGFTIDAGPDALLIQKPEAICLCREIGLGDRLVSTRPPRLAYIQRSGRLHALPAASVLGIPTRIEPFLRTHVFSWSGKLRMAAELFVPARTDDADESIGAFMTRRFGREATDYLAEPLLAGIHAGDVHRLSIKSLFPRFRDAERKYGSLLRAFASPSSRGAKTTNGAARPVNPSERPTDDEGAFKSLPGGLTEMVDALGTALGTMNIRTNARIAEVAGTGPFDVRLSSGELLRARAVVFATPTYATADLLQRRDARLASLCGAVPYSSVATVALAYRRSAIAHPLNGSGFVVPRLEKSGILAGSWLSSKWPNRAPEDAALLRTFIGGARDPQAFEHDDRDLIARSIAALTPILGIRADPLFTRVYRWTRASAQHEVGHLDRVAAIDAALAGHPGLFVTGSGFRGVGIPDCVADGRSTAFRVSDWLEKNRLLTTTT